MKIEKLPSGSYRVRKMYKGKTYSLTFDQKPTKAQIEKELFARIKTTEDQQHSGNTFKSAAEKYCESKENVLSPKTIREYKNMLSNFPSWFVDMPIDCITQTELNLVVNEIAKDRSAKTVRNRHGFISAVIKSVNPSMKITTTLPQKKKEKIYIPTDTEVKAILKELEGTMFYVPISLACYGLRRGEILALEPGDIEGCIVHITKSKVQNADKEWVIKSCKTTESERDIMISQHLVDIINEQGYVYNGAPNSIVVKLEATQKKLGIKKFSLHKMRHYFASKMLTITDKKSTQELGGWKSSEVMDRIYAHSMEEEKEKARKGAVDMFNNSLFS